MNYSRETLEASLNSLTVNKAHQMIGLAGSAAELTDTIERLARSFNATVPDAARQTIKLAARNFNRAPKYSHMGVKYNA